ncbi:MAG TPA: hypothetical protein VGI00_19370 [Streptosporangiaceae bacterium]|jgi:hypothetical protein
MMLVALIVEIWIGSGNGHSRIVIDGVQFTGALLVVVFGVLAYQHDAAKRR